MITPVSRALRQPGYLGVLRGVAGGVAEEARTRGFASLSFLRFAFIGAILVPQATNVVKYP